MFLIKLMRKLGKIIRGGVKPRQIALGAVLGVMIGMIPGFNLSLVAGIILLLLLNAHVGIALLGLAIGKIGMLLLAPITFRLGYLIIHAIGLEAVFRGLANTPVTALLDLQVYCLTGGIPVAIIIGLAFAWLIVHIVQALQKGIIEAGSRSERMQRLAENPVVRLFMRIVFGKQKKTIQEMMEADQPLFRKSGIILTGIIVLLGVGCQFLLLDYLFASGLKAGLEFANGAEVNITRADMSLFEGKLEVEGLRMTDPANPSHNSMQAERLSADISITDLLRKRYVVDLLAVHSVQFNTPRKTPGEVYEPPPEAPPVEEKKKTVYHYLKHARTLRDYAAKLQKYLERQKTRQKPEVEREKERRSQLFETAQNRGYLGLSAQSLLTEEPTWTIRKTEVDGLRIPGLKTAQNLHAKNVSSHPELLNTPMLFRMAATSEAPPSALVEFNLHKPQTMNSLKLNLKDVSLQGGKGLTKAVPVDVDDGKADLNIKGRFSADRIDFPFAIDLSQLQASAREDERVLGMDPATARKVFRNISTLKLQGAITGSFTSPRLQLDLEKTLNSLKSELGEATRKKLMETGREKLEEEAGGTLNRFLKKDENGDEEKKEDGDEEEDATDKLKQLF